ncbi:MAG TPA: helix-turn-helix domain-containing protein, partial [Acidimicrobiales bacterium]|nr:helix-turn-helix domain-containing protein [Acidimicrobiales bacterium]
MVPDTDMPSVQSTTVGLGAALRRAWLGYQLRVDRAMAEAGFGERKFPDGRVLRVCSVEGGSTIAAIGRELGITRQGASKVVAHLRDRGYVLVADSTTSKREKSVVL